MRENDVPMPAKQVSRGNRKFAFDFYNALKDNGLNCALSPYSLSSCMGMVSMIAEGETLEQIQEVMHFPKYPLTLDFGFRALNESMTSGMAIGGEPVHLTPTNRIWTQEGTIISPAILTKVMHYWDGIDQADFIGDAQKARATINAYVEEKTNGKIEELLQEGSVDQNTRMVAINTLYFSAPWKKPFDEGATQEDLFHGLKQDAFIPFMHKEELLNVAQNDQYTVVEIPFTASLSTESEISLYVILPQVGVDFQEFEQNLSKREFRQAIKGMEMKNVALSFPKFSLESHSSLKPTLMKMGLTLPFLPEGGFPFANGEGQKLVLSDVIQAVKVDFNEWGSTCAAATGGVIGITCFPEKQAAMDLACDRPFIFVLADKTTKSILFMGKFVQPN